MMHEIRLFNLHSNALATALASRLEIPTASLEMRQFPDGESYFRIEEPIAECHALILANLHHPDNHTLPVLLLADTLRDLGASRITLIAPYLPYMRQDQRFKAGEGVTSRYYAAMLSSHFDGLVTIDPHLHRYSSLDEIYSIPSRVEHAAGSIAAWIAKNVDKPVLIGPDAESEQWVAAVAQMVDLPYTVLAKIRRGDHDVEVSVPEIRRWRKHTPVLVDDIISSGHTMLETLEQLDRLSLDRAVCVGVHAVFDRQAAASLIAAAARVVTTNSIPHETSEVDIANVLASGVLKLWRTN